VAIIAEDRLFRIPRYRKKRKTKGNYLWKLPAPTIFFFDNALKIPDTTSNVGSS
jgi:stalled ribosome alternative rescue factor ArfA